MAEENNSDMRKWKGNWNAFCIKEKKEGSIARCFKKKEVFYLFLFYFNFIFLLVFMLFYFFIFNFFLKGCNMSDHDWHSILFKVLLHAPLFCLVLFYFSVLQFFAKPHTSSFLCTLCFIIFILDPTRLYFVIPFVYILNPLFIFYSCYLI